MIEAKPTSPLTYTDSKGNTYRLTRRFLGEIVAKTTMDKKEMLAYVKGQERFSYKRDENGNPIYYKVRQKYFYLPN